MRIITLTLFFILAQSCFSQDILKGKVIGMDDNLYLPMVMVINESTGDTVQTDMEGLFSLKVEIGHQLTFRYLGYVPRSYTVEDFDFLTIGLMPAMTWHDYGWNRFYIGPRFDLSNSIFGGSIEYLSNPFFGYDFYINPRFRYFKNKNKEILDSKLNILEAIPSLRVHISASLRCQKVQFQEFNFENYTLSALPWIRGHTLEFGVSRSSYHLENNTNDYIGFLVGYQREFLLFGNYFPFKANAVFWKDDLEINIEASKKFARWLRTSLIYQHYRDFNQFEISIQFSFGLERPPKWEY